MVFVFVCKLQPVPLCTLCSAGTRPASHQQPRSYTWGGGIALDIYIFWRNGAGGVFAVDLGGFFLNK